MLRDKLSPGSARYPGLAPDSFTTFAHFAVSSMRNFSRSATEPEKPVPPALLATADEVIE